MMQIITILVSIGALLGIMIGLLGKSDKWQILGRAVIGASGATMGGLLVSILTGNMLVIALAALLSSFLVIAVTAGSLDS